MRRLPLVAVAVLAFTLAAGCGGTSSTPGPYRTVEIFVDGFNHGDYRQACTVSVTHDNAATNMSACERFYTGTAAQGIFFGVWAGYVVVPHTLKTWTETYQGRQVELAVVEFQYRPGGKQTWGQPLTAHLRKTGSGWKIWNID